MKITYLGTTMLLFDDGQDQLLFDCHVTRPSLLRCFLGSLQTDEETADRVIREFGMDRLRAIFISHSHYDHILDAPYFARRCGAEIYGSSSAVQVALGGGVAPEKIHSYAEAMCWQVGSFGITVLPSIHSKAHWYNNDLGQTIDQPLRQPAPKKAYKEGGSFDLLVTHGGKRCLIRPSYNFLPGQLDDVQADVLFLGIGGLAGDQEERRQRFYAETLDKVRPQAVIPVHWDNFFQPLYNREHWMTGVLDDPKQAIAAAKQACEQRKIKFLLMEPLSEAEL